MKIIIVPGFGRAGTISYKEFFMGHPDINFISTFSQQEIQGSPGQFLPLDLFRNALDGLHDNVAICEGRITSDPQHAEVWADMFQQYAPDARIIFSRRDPLENLQAWYSVQYRDIRTKKTVGFKTFLEGLWHDRDSSFLGALHHKHSIDHYTKRFNDVLIYQMIPHLSSGQAFEDICDYLDIEFISNVPLSMRHARRSTRLRNYEYLRGLIPISFGGKIRGILSRYLSRGKRLNPKFPPGWEERLRDYYAS